MDRDARLDYEHLGLIDDDPSPQIDWRARAEKAERERDELSRDFNGMVNALSDVFAADFTNDHENYEQTVAFIGRVTLREGSTTG
jgi:hypothetical protein